MFPRLRQRFGSALLPRLDVVVELSTLGEYGIDEQGRPLLLEAVGDDGAGHGAPLSFGGLIPRRRGHCAARREARPRRGGPPARS